MADTRTRIRSDGRKIHQVRWKDPTKKSGFSYRSFTLKKEADLFEAEKTLEEQNFSPKQTIKDMNQAVSFWLDLCETQGTSRNDEPVTPYTIKQYSFLGSILLRYNWVKRPHELSTPDIVQFKDWLLKNCSSIDQARRVLTSLKTILNELALRGMITSNMAAPVTIKKDSRYAEEVQIPTEKEFQDLLRASDRLANSKNAMIANAWERYRVMIYYAGDTGMRPQEYIAMPINNLEETGSLVNQAIEAPGRKISVVKTRNGRRFIPGSKDVLGMVEHYYKNIAAPSPYNLVFPTSTGRWQDGKNWREHGFSRACEEAGLLTEVDTKGKKIIKPKYSPYSLRHYYASLLIDKGLNPKQVQKRMGHADIETTFNIYGHLIEKKYDDGRFDKGLIDLSE